MQRLWVFSVRVLFLFAVCLDARGQCEIVRDVAFDGKPNDRFGSAVAVSGNVAVVGSPIDRDAGIRSGSAYVFERDPSGWQFVDKLLPSGRAAYDDLGFSVAVSGKTLVVGALNGDAVYLYERVASTWVEVAKLEPSDPGPFDGFGMAVSVLGDIVVVGAPGYNFSTSTGAVYVYQRDQGVWPTHETWKLTASDATPGRRYGRAVAMTPGQIVVGSPGTGSVYVNEKVPSGWIETAKLIPSDGQIGGGVGSALAATEDTILIGASAHGEWQVHLDNLAGAAWVFERRGGAWVETVELIGTGAGLNREAALSVALEGDRAFLGVGWDWSESMGVVFVFDRTPTGDWEQMETRQLRRYWGAQSYEAFGQSIAVDGDTLVVGAPRAEYLGSYSGAVYWLDADDIGTPYCDNARLNSTNYPGRIAVCGSKVAADDRLTLTARQLPLGNIGYFIAGARSAHVLPPGSAGILCVGGSTMRRLLPPVLSTDQLGGGFGVSPGTRAVPGLGTIVPGRAWNFQAWYRDVAFGTSNFTDAVSVTFE